MAERCMAEHWDDVAERYSEVIAARMAATQEIRLATLRDCLRDLGFEIEDDADWDTVGPLSHESDDALGCLFDYIDG